MTKFSEYIKKDVPKSDEKIARETVENVFNRYTDFSEDELMREFQEKTNERKANGEPVGEKLSQIATTLMPYLDEAQQEKLANIIKMVK